MPRVSEDSKESGLSHRSTETSEILFLFSPLMLSSRSRLSRKLNTHSILAFSAVNSDPRVGVRSVFYTKNENFYTRANQYKKHRTGKKVQSFQERLAVKTKVTETLTDLPQTYICCWNEKKKKMFTETEAVILCSVTLKGEKTKESDPLCQILPSRLV